LKATEEEQLVLNDSASQRAPNWFLLRLSCFGAK
jgi:hypothetical protein